MQRLARAWGSRLFVPAVLGAWAVLTALSVVLAGAAGKWALALLRLPALGMAARLRLPWSLLGAAVGAQIELQNGSGPLPDEVPQLVGIVLSYGILALIAQAFYAATASVTRHARERDELAAGLVVADERERRRLADELHDGPLQSVTAARLQLAISEHAADPDVGRCTDMLTVAAAEMRRITAELLPSPMPAGGLAAAVDELANTLGERYGAQIVVHGRPSALAEAQGEEVLPLLREAMTNAVKHGRPPVSVTALEGGFEVADAGPGFDPAAGRPADRFGLLLARARAAAAGAGFTVESAPGHPTVVRITLPVARDPGEAHGGRGG